MNLDGPVIKFTGLFKGPVPFLKDSLRNLAGLPVAPQVVIVGGRGQMGKVFHRIFLEVDAKIQIIDLPFNTSNTIVEQADIVVLAVPINQTISVINELGPRVNPQGLMMDITSLKKEFLDRMLAVCKCEVIGTHPLFGPLKIIEGQTIAVTVPTPGRWYPYIESLFKRLGLKVVMTTGEVHDRAMGVVQSLVHFMLIALSACVGDQKNRIGAPLDQLTTHFYLIQKNLAGRLLNQDPALYADIAFLNKDVVPLLENYLGYFQKLVQFLKEQDRGGFIDFFQTCSNNEENKDQAYHFVERIMEYLADLEK